MKKRKKRKKKIYKLTIVFIILDLLAIGGYFLTYGPWGYFRELLINTAMKTMTHQYFAYIFYNEETVNKILNSNYFVEIQENVKADDIVIDTREKKHYDNEYDKEVLTRENGNDEYKIINVKIGNSSGYLVAIYHPEKVHVIHIKKFDQNGYGERVFTMCNRYGGTVCINAGGFVDNGTGSDIPLGYVIDGGEIIWPLEGHDTTRGNIIGLNDEGKLILMGNATGTEALEAGIKEAVEFGPFLIVNGEPLEIVGNPWGKSPRVAIAQRKDGVMMFLVIDGENYINGATLQDMIDILLQYGAYNAANLDGGHSTSLTVNGKLYNNPPSMAKSQGGRYVVTGLGLIP